MSQSVCFICGPLQKKPIKIMWTVIGNSLNIPILQLTGALAFAVIFFSIYHNFDPGYKLHMCFNTIGLALLTSEAIMVVANKPFCAPLTANQNTLVHVMMTTCGLCFVAAGIIVMVFYKCEKVEPHFSSIHGITGLTAMLFLIVALVLGFLSSLCKLLNFYHVTNFSNDSLKWFLLPHYIFGILGYAIGMGSLCYGIGSASFSSKVNFEFRVICIVSTVITACWTMIYSFIELCAILHTLVHIYEVENNFQDISYQESSTT